MAAVQPDEARIVALVRASEQAAATRPGDAAELLEQARRLAPDHPLVLNATAIERLKAGDAAGARALLERGTALAPKFQPLWLTLALAYRALNQPDAELAALDTLLSLESRHLLALLQKATLLELLGRKKQAAGVYRAALLTIPPGASLPEQLREAIEIAQRAVAAGAAVLERLLSDGLREPRGRLAGESLDRFDRCIDLMLAKKRLYTPAPSFMHFPFLSNREFYPRELFPWLTALEAASGSIREELVEVLKEDSESFVPYIDYPEYRPLDQWRDLNRSRRWGAYFLWQDGAAIEEHQARCPRTVAALKAIARFEVPRRGPTAFFSLLDAHTHIPAHTGTSNIRLTVHLPLVLPGNCRFRVGGETREWVAGQAWAFDDTIEHEAWNDSELPRAVLIFDIWHPELTNAEREMLTTATAVLAEYTDAP
jgi:aspartyl/asparaginyl beta-hydroxylase (cupin superfamily)